MTSRRVSAIEIHQVPGRRDLYSVSLEFSNKGSGAIGGGGGSPSGFPHPPSMASFVQQVAGAGSFTMPDGPVATGDTLVWVGNSRGGETWDYAAFGYTLVDIATILAGSSQSMCVYKLADGSEGTTLNMADAHMSGVWFEFPGEWMPAGSATAVGAGSPVSVGPVTGPTSGIVLTASAYGNGGAYDSQAALDNTTPGSGWTEDYDAATPSGGGPTSYVAHQFTSGSVTATSGNSAAGGAADGFGANTTNWCAVIAAFESVDGTFEQPPAPGQWVNHEIVTPVPDGVTTTFSTRWPFANGSLQVWVNGTDQTASLASYDGAAGTFTFSWAPHVGEAPMVRYQGR